MNVAEMYPARTDASGVTWYRPAFDGGSPPSMWGWTSQPDQAHPDYDAYRPVDRWGNWLQLPRGYRYLTAPETETYQASGLLDPTVVSVRVGGIDADPRTDLAMPI